MQPIKIPLIKDPPKAFRPEIEQAAWREHWHHRACIRRLQKTYAISRYHNPALPKRPPDLPGGGDEEGQRIRSFIRQFRIREYNRHLWFEHPIDARRIGHHLGSQMNDAQIRNADLWLGTPTPEHPATPGRHFLPWNYYAKTNALELSRPVSLHLTLDLCPAHIPDTPPYIRIYNCKLLLCDFNPKAPSQPFWAFLAEFRTAAGKAFTE